MRTTIENLKQKLQSTQFVRDILSGQTPYSDLIEYRLHKDISDLQPDTALLTIAVMAKDLVNNLANLPYASLKILGIECERILEEYAPLWLENAKTNNVDHKQALDLLINIPDDFESLVALLSLNRDLLSDTHNIESSIFNILNVQSAAHALIAEEYIAVLHQNASQNDSSLAIEMAHIPNNNVIHFPVSAQA